MEFSLSQIVSNPSRISAGHSSILDFVLLSNPQLLLSYTITEPIATSDHLSVLIQLSSSNRPPKVKPTRRKVWIYKAANTELASDLFSSFDASVLKQNCVNESWSVWKSKFWSVIHATIPSKSVPTRRNLLWLSREISLAIRKCNYLFWKSKRSRNPNHLQRYHTARNKVVYMIHQAKKDFFQSLAESRPDPKDFWCAVRKAQPKVRSLPPELRFNDSIARTLLDKATLLNFFFNQCFNQVQVVPTFTLPVNITVPPGFYTKQKTLNLLFPLSVLLYLVVLISLLEGCLSCLHTRLLHLSVEFSISLSVKGNYLKNGSMLT